MSHSQISMPSRRRWTKERITKQLGRDKHFSWSYLRKHNPRLLSACEKHFGSLRKAVETLGLDYDEIRVIKPVTKKWLIREIHSFVASGGPVSTLYTTHSTLMRKSKRLYGSVSGAFGAAGYRYDELKRNPGHSSIWPAGHDVLEAIRRLPATYNRRVHKNHRGLEERAEKFFGSWKKAVEAAGLTYGYQPPSKWPGELILRKIRRLNDKSHGANVGTRFYYSARAAFGSWRYAVELAGFPYFDVEPRFRWHPKEVLYYIRWLSGRDLDFRGRDYPDLYKSALKLFGSWGNAVQAAESTPMGIHFKYRIRRPRETKSNPEIARDVPV